jgi:hypothetical protein
VFLHVGSPKTGTTFLQNVLWSQRDRAAAQGLLLPLDGFSDHYLATLDVRGLAGRGKHPPRARGIWQRVVQAAEAWDGTVLVSHELFSAATAEQAAAAVTSFGPDTEVHVVLTARDLVRQIPAEWQEHVKHRSTSTLEQFVDSLQQDRSGRSWFWQVQDFADVLERWGAPLPPERVHVVTVPGGGADPDTLWQRFAGLLGLDPASFDTRRSRANTSLNKEQAELLRRFNDDLGDRLSLPGPYPVVVKNVLAHRVLAVRGGTRLALDPSAMRYAVSRSAELADDLGKAGYDVVGDLDELVPDLDTALSQAADDAYAVPSDSALLTESIGALTGVLEAMARDRAQLRRLTEWERTMREHPVRFALVRASERNRPLMWARKGYRKLAAVRRGG